MKRFKNAKANFHKANQNRRANKEDGGGSEMYDQGQTK
jgi:hypothetical protein